MLNKPILFFDSGLGGLSVMREARLKILNKRFLYVADDSFFPYGSKKPSELKNHLLDLFKDLIKKFDPCLCIIACNTASTLALADLRKNFSEIEFVGTVPAIKYAAESTFSGLISVLATPSTVNREYTKDLIKKHATNCEVTLVGAKNLAAISETYLRKDIIDHDLLLKEISSIFINKNNKRTDVVVLACTHYPFLINEMRKVAPWPVDWIDPSQAIANRAKHLLKMKNDFSSDELLPDQAYFTSQDVDIHTKRLLQAFGLSLIT